MFNLVKIVFVLAVSVWLYKAVNSGTSKINGFMDEVKSKGIVKTITGGNKTGGGSSQGTGGGVVIQEFLESDSVYPDQRNRRVNGKNQ